MKVIEGKHYVDGGPECTATGYIIPGEYGNPHLNSCPWCHGTGLLPVELWPDAVKAEWLIKNCRFPQIHLADAGVFHPPLNGIYVTCVSEGGGRYYLTVPEPDFSAALTAAVIAVAESEGK